MLMPEPHPASPFVHSSSSFPTPTRHPDALNLPPPRKTPLSTPPSFSASAVPALTPRAAGASAAAAAGASPASSHHEQPSSWWPFPASAAPTSTTRTGEGAPSERGLRAGAATAAASSPVVPVRETCTGEGGARAPPSSGGGGRAGATAAASPCPAGQPSWWQLVAAADKSAQDGLAVDAGGGKAS